MTQAGWYPDPAGQPQTYRFWNGSSWSQETTSDPYAPPPGAQAAPPPPPTPPPTPPAAASPPQPPPTVIAGGGGAPSPYGQVPTPGYGAATPPPAGGYGQQPPYGGGYPPAPPAGGSGGSGGSAKTVLLVVAAVLVLILLSAGGFFGFRALTGDDDDGDNEAVDRTSATDETGSTDPTESTETESTGPTETTPTTPPPSTQCTGGLPEPSVTPRRNAERISGGALSIPIPAGFKPEVLFAPAFAWADNFTPLVRTVEENPEAQTSWFSIFGVGGLRKANGFGDPAAAAEAVMTCMIESPDQYSDVTGRTEVSAGEITVDGTDAYQLTVEIRVDNEDLETEGDIAQVIVVDMGDPDMYGLYISQVPIGDQELLDLQTSMVDRILVD